MILKKNYVKKEYTENRNSILNGEDDIIKLLNNKVDKSKNRKNFVLVETLLYFFRKKFIKLFK